MIHVRYIICLILCWGMGFGLGWLIVNVDWFRTVSAALFAIAVAGAFSIWLPIKLKCL